MIREVAAEDHLPGSDCLVTKHSPFRPIVIHFLLRDFEISSVTVLCTPQGFTVVIYLHTYHTYLLSQPTRSHTFRPPVGFAFTTFMFPNFLSRIIPTPPNQKSASPFQIFPSGVVSLSPTPPSTPPQTSSPLIGGFAHKLEPTYEPCPLYFSVGSPMLFRPFFDQTGQSLIFSTTFAASPTRCRSLRFTPPMSLTRFCAFSFTHRRHGSPRV